MADAKSSDAAGDTAGDAGGVARDDTGGAGKPLIEQLRGRDGIAELVGRYDTILLDAYGVLVDSVGPLAAAPTILEVIAESGRPFFVVTNDASRLPGTCAERFRGFGLDIPAEQIITSGSLLVSHFAAEGLQGARTKVLGPADSATYVKRAGGEVVPLGADVECDAVVVCDEAGYPFLVTVDDVLSGLYWQLDRGESVALIQPNPDLIYPKKNGTYGYTSGAATLLLEAGLARRYPRRGLTFRCLGKPHRPIFDEARRRSGTDSLLMFGDQLETDIAGARGAGIDAVLVSTGVTRWQEADPGDELAPTCILTL